MGELSILQILRDDFKVASETLTKASEEFDRIIAQTPSGLPHPDGVQRILNISRELSVSRRSLLTSIDRLNEFLTRGVVPQDLDDRNVRLRRITRLIAQNVNSFVCALRTARGCN